MGAGFSVCFLQSNIADLDDSPDIEDESANKEQLLPRFREFSLDQLRTATSEFSSENLVSDHGEKAPNVVYKGKLEDSDWIVEKCFDPLLGLIHTSLLFEEARAVGQLRKLYIAGSMVCFDGS